MTPMNFEIGLSQSEAQSLKGGPFGVTQGDWILGGSGKLDAPRAVATNWGLLAVIAGLVLVAVVGLAVFGKRKGR